MCAVAGVFHYIPCSVFTSLTFVFRAYEPRRLLLVNVGFGGEEALEGTDVRWIHPTEVAVSVGDVFR